MDVEEALEALIRAAGEDPADVRMLRYAGPPHASLDIITRGQRKRVEVDRIKVVGPDKRPIDPPGRGD